MLKKYFAIVLILLFIIVPINANAESLEIPRWNVSSQLLENGDLQITEDITYDFNEEFNGVYRDINLDGIDGIGDLRIQEVTHGEPIEYLNDQGAKKGDAHVYSYEMNGDTIRYMIFSPSKDVQKVFRLSYTLKNVAVIHEDTGELYFKYLGDENETPIGYFSASILLPDMDKENVKIFAHGPLNGTINFSENDLIVLEVENVPSNTFIEARVLYPKIYTPLALRMGESNLNVILEEEASFVEAIEQDGIKKENRRNLFNKVSIGLSVIGAALSAFFISLISKDKRVDYNQDLYPEYISPAEVNMFMNSYMDAKALMATLFDLARREHISIEELNKDASIYSKKDLKDKDYVFTRTNKADGSLLDHERYLLDWLFNDIGNGSKVSTLDIDYSRKKKIAAFSKAQSQWNKLVMEQLKKREYSNPKYNKIGVSIILFSIPLIALSIISLAVGGLNGIISLVVSIIVFVFGIILATRKSNKGYTQYNLWKDFKKEFKNYSNYDISIPKDKVLIYAVALGFSMEDLDKSRQYYGPNYYPMYWGLWYFNSTNRKGGSNFEDSLNHSFYGSTGTSTPTSTNFGGGGGFSGGGGGGAGGGGSGGF